MDTRFWGPSGWKLLHLVSFNYTYTPENAVLYSTFFETIPYILPCKYCRTSLTDYYREHPFQVTKDYHFANASMNPMLDVKRWLYTIHNCVNDKLRNQGLYATPNPSFIKVKTQYDALSKESWDTQLLLLWDFLFAVGYNHPLQAHSSPMPDCPHGIKKSDKCELNKWNVLPVKDRLRWYKQFWTYLPVVLPVTISKKWLEVQKNNPPVFTCRKSILAWLWRMRCGLDTKFKDPYTTVCKKIASYSSDCGTKRYGITCRKRYRQRSKTQKTKS